MKRFAEDEDQPSGFTDLILASALELTALVEYLLLKRVDVNARDKEGAAALNRAVRPDERSRGDLSTSVGGSDTQKASGGSTPGEEIEHNTKTGSSRTDISIDVDYVESELHCVDEVEDLDQIDDMYHDQTIAICDSDIYIGPAFDGKLPPDEIVEKWEHTTKAIRKMTLLHIAASKGTKHVVRLLLHHGACERPESATLAEPTALHLAALMGQSQVVKCCLMGL